VPVRAVSLDLFDTLVDIHMDRLPLVEIAGRRIPSTYGLLHDASVHRHALDFESFALALGKVDREFRDAMQRQQVEVATLERFRELGRRIGCADDGLARTLTDVHMAELQKHVTTLAHHAEVLARLRGRVRLAVCSNFSHTETARAVLERAGLLEHLDGVVISMDLGVRKPRPEIFRAALQSLGAAPGETLHVGDDLAADVAGAYAVGMQPVWLTRRVSDPAGKLATYGGPKPAHTIADLAELETLIG
jgi:HAD superfamily hydrolase (TIGR01509 family)